MFIKVYVEVNQQEYLLARKGVHVSNVFEPVVCSGCGYSNIISASSTVVAEFDHRPYLTHLLVRCGSRGCNLWVPVWTSSAKLAEAARLGCRYDRQSEPSLDVWVEYLAQVWEFDLGDEQENLLRVLRAEIDYYEGELAQRIAEARTDVCLAKVWATPASNSRYRPAPQVRAA